MKSSKHLVVLTPGFAAGDEDSQTVVFIQNLLRALNSIYPNIEVSIIAFQYPFTDKPYKWNRNIVYPLNGRNSKIRKIFTWKKATRKLRELHQQKNIDAIFCCWLNECSLIGKQFGLKNNIPFLCWAAGQDARPENRYLKLLRLKDHEVAVIGERQIELLSQSGIQCSRKIENGISGDAPLKESSPYSIHVFGAGSLIPLKNYVEFIQVIRIVKNSFPEIRCGIAGGGPQFEELNNLIQQHNLEKNIKLCGPLTNSEVLERMKQSLIFLHPSMYEGNSTAVLEAAYCGNFILCKPEVSLYDHPHIVNYSGTEEAASHIERIISDFRRKPSGVILSSAKQQARKLINYLQLDV